MVVYPLLLFPLVHREPCHGPLPARYRSRHADLLRRLARARPALVRRRRGRQTRARRGGLYGPPPPPRSQDHPPRPPGTSPAIPPAPGALPQKGGGRKRKILPWPNLHVAFGNVLHDHTAGSPEDADLFWTNLSRQEIAARL